jgi:hypothetical protein
VRGTDARALRGLEPRGGCAGRGAGVRRIPGFELPCADRPVSVGNCFNTKLEPDSLTPQQAGSAGTAKTH